MSFQLHHDFFHNPIVPSYILCKSNKERIGILKCTSKQITVKFNAIDEIHFTAYLYHDGEKNMYYDEIDVMKYILLPDIGLFAIDSVDIESEGTKSEHKNVVGKSYECLLGQKYLDTFTINMGTTESIDGVSFYNMRDPSKSLLHLVLEKNPDWSFGHIDPALPTMERSFEVSKQDVYSFLTTDISQAFGCIFLFDTLQNLIHVYEEKNLGEDTDVYVSYKNLLKNASFSWNVSDIKTCLTLIGEDDLTIRELNMGYDKIYNLAYFNSTAFMSQSLYDAYNQWIQKRKDYVNPYTSLLSQYERYYGKINELTNLKMPTDPESTNWSEYGLIPLQEQLTMEEKRQAVMMKAGWGNPDNGNYNSKYLPVYHRILAIQSQISRINTELNNLKKAQSTVFSQMKNIMNALSMNNNFTKEQLKELTAFIREDELNSRHFVVTKSMTDEERFRVLHEFLDYGEKELAKAAVPQLSFSANMVHLFSIPEFQKFNGVFDVGNYIHVSIRDDYLVKARLLTMTVDFYDMTNFKITFGNVLRQHGKILDVTKAITMAQSAATSLSLNASHWDQAKKDTSSIGKILDEGLLSAGKYLKNGDDSEMVIDSRGIFVNTTSGSYSGKDSIFVGGGRILFTEDHWKTVSMSVGRADVTIKGKTQSRFGTFADFVIAGYIGGSILEGDEIYGGMIQSTNYSPGKTGAILDLNKGTLEFNGNNERKLTLDSNGTLTVKGTIQADLGYIGGQGGFTITSGKLYSGKTSLDSNTTGVYIGTEGIALGANSMFKVLEDGSFFAEKGLIGGSQGFVLEQRKLYSRKPSLTAMENGIYIGTDGIALGTNNVFQVTPQGILTAKSGFIGGAVITNNSIHSENRNWWISSDGSASFKNVYISDVKNGSHFGSVGYSEGTTWGSFGGSSYYGSNVGSPFSGTCISHIEAISTQYIRAQYLDAMCAYIENLQLQCATLANLVAININRISALEVDNLSIKNTLTTHSTEIKKLKTAPICVDRLTAGKINGRNVDWREQEIITEIRMEERVMIKSINFLTKTVEKERFPIVTGYTARNLYFLCSD